MMIIPVVIYAFLLTVYPTTSSIIYSKLVRSVSIFFYNSSMLNIYTINSRRHWRRSTMTISAFQLLPTMKTLTPTVSWSMTV